VLRCDDEAPSCLRDRGTLGITSIEYALMGSLIVLGLLLGASALGDAVQDAYDFVAEQVSDVLQ